MGITALFRIYQGGAGTSMGVAVIFSTGLLGLAWRHMRTRPLSTLSGRELYIFGLVIHVVMLLCGFFLPKEIAWSVIGKIILPVLIIYPFATSFLGLIFVNQLKRYKAIYDLANNENRLKSIHKILQSSVVNQEDLFTLTLEEAVKNTNSQIGFLYTCISNIPDCQLVSRISSKSISSELAEGFTREWESMAIYKEAIIKNTWIIKKSRQVMEKTEDHPLSKSYRIQDMLAVPVSSNGVVVAVLGVATNQYSYEEGDCTHISLLLDAAWKIIERNKVEKSLSSIEWMLTKKVGLFLQDGTAQREHTVKMTGLNKDGLIFTSVGRDLLLDIARDYLDLLGTSAAIYEQNGEYALAVFSSAWCNFMDDSSRQLCTTDNLDEALQSGKWLCHESCWSKCSKISIQTEEVVDIECDGGIHIYSVPIFANQEVVGAINFGYGDPPKDKRALQELAEKYQVDSEELVRLANAYESRPPFIIELAKQRLHNSANLIGMLIEKNQAQAKLKSNESLLNKIFNILPIGLWFADRNGKLQRGNPAGVKIWGAEPLVELSEYGVFKARSLPSRQELGADDWALSKTIKYGDTIEEELLEIDAFDGTKKIILNYSTPLKNEKGEIEGAVVVNLDTTERVRSQEKVKEAQEELQRLLSEADQARQVLLSVIEDQKIAEEKIVQLNQELEERVTNRTVQLEVANRELEAFAYSVSHDLRAPLRAMDGFSAALLEDYPDKLDEQGRHYLARIQEASRKMGQLIEDLLNLSRVTRREIIKESVNLSEISLEIAEEYKKQSSEHPIEFIIQEEMITQADSHLIRIVLENLISNACKFSGNKDKPIIEIGCSNQNGEPVFFVKDNGVGFNMKYISKLFNPFQRLHSVEEFPGTGIGLVTVQRIINRHGGRIWPESSIDHGATFFFTLGGKNE
jgi:signal transduction histidine kinase